MGKRRWAGQGGRDRAIGILLQPGPSQVGLTSDSPRTQICILGCWIATGKRASHTEAPACPQTAGYSRQSQGSVQWSPRGLAGNMGVDEGRRPAIRSVALTALAICLPCTCLSLVFMGEPPSSQFHPVGPSATLVWIIMSNIEARCTEGLMVTRDMRHKKVRSERSQCVPSTGSFTAIGLKSRSCESQ